MLVFARYKTSQFYESEAQETKFGYLAYYAINDSGLTTITYTESWSTYIGVYLFLANKPDDIDAFVNALKKHFPAGSLTHTSVAWITWDTSTAKITLVNVMRAGRAAPEAAPILNDRFNLEILQSSFLLARESPISPKLDGSGNLEGLIVEYPDLAEGTPVRVVSQNVHIPLTGPYRGCLSGEVTMDEGAAQAGRPEQGFYFFITKPEHPDRYLSRFYPLFASTPAEGADPVYSLYAMRYDPLAPYNAGRTRFTTLGVAYRVIAIQDPPYRQIELVEGKALAHLTQYTTVFGDPVSLVPMASSSDPGGYVLCALPPGHSAPYYMAPAGDFEVVSEKDISLASGLSGTEYFHVPGTTAGTSGATIRFFPDRPACVKDFPFALASPVGPPMDPTASPFSAAYKTSWATVFVTGSLSIPYVSQPAGAPLYGNPTKNTGLLRPVNPPFAFASNKKDPFPFVPNAGLQSAQAHGMSDADTQALEATVLSKERHAVIHQQGSPTTASPSLDCTQTTQHIATTPAGLLATNTQCSDGYVISWDKFLLARNGGNELAFNQPPAEVVTALQADNVFLVVSNAQHLGNFANTVTIGDWELQANIGEKQHYGDYSNLMLFKGRKGKLYDPNDPGNSLVANPKKWSQAENFSIPQTQGAPDPAQLIILSNWLQTYFENAHAQTSDYFANFNRIAQDENWTGLLFLRVDIEQLPTNLSGITAGVTNPAAFNAHHLGVQISPVKLNAQGVPELSHPSSLFGLIYYQDPNFVDGPHPRAIAPSNSNTYNFQLLSLKVLFENSAVKSFESYAQLTLNALFGSAVTKTHQPDNIYKNVLLAGSLQINHGQPVYSLSSQRKNAFYLDSNIIHKVEVNDVFLANRSKENAQEQVSWFGISGFMDFYILSGLEDKDGQQQRVDYDLFSFGNKAGEDHLRKGLHFSNLGIEMTFPKDNPARSTLSFSAGEVRFNPAPQVSTLRRGSLYRNLSLTLENLVVGRPGQSPQTSGYLDVVPGIRLSGPGSGEWYGLRLNVNMGTPGALAGNVGLHAYLLLSWSPESRDPDNYRAGIGIALPGSGGNGQLLSLQTVLKLSLGQILLKQVPAASGSTDKVFMLLFTEIALKFLGLLKIPPNGNTLFYLFGNPQAEGKASALGWYAMYKKT